MNKTHAKIRTLAANLVLSYLADGYKMVSQSYGCETVTLRHESNGNSLLVRCSQLGVHVYKNNKLVSVEIL